MSPLSSLPVPRRRGWIAVAAAGLLLLPALSLLSKPGSDPDALDGGIASGREPGVLRRGAQADPESLDIHRASGGMESRILGDLFEGLTTVDAHNRVVPGAAESWTVSEDGLIYRFRLRADGRWSNGDPVTAQDFVFSFRRLLDPRTAAPYANLFYPIENGEAINEGRMPPARLGVRAVAPRMLEMRLSRPVAYLPNLLINFFAAPIHRPSFNRNGAGWTRPGKLVGNGAYRLVAWQRHVQVVLRKSPHYRDAANVSIPEVRYIPTENREQELRRYRVGSIDTTEDVPAAQIDWLREHLPDQLVISPRLATLYFAFNLADPRLGDRRVRQALYLALDRERIVSRLTRAGERPAYSIVPAAMPGYDAPDIRAGGMTPERRLALAQRLMREAGYSTANPLRLEILYFTSSDMRRIALAAAVMWRPLGVLVSFRNMEQKVFLAALGARDYQVILTGWNADFKDPLTFLEMFHSQSEGINQTGYDNPRFDQLVDRAARTVERDARATLLARAEAVMIQDAPVAPVYFSVTRYLVKPYVLNWNRELDMPPLTRHLALAPARAGQEVE